MPTNDTATDITRDLRSAIDELQTALKRAAEATAQIQALLPRIGALGALFDDLSATVESGRRQFGAQAARPIVPAGSRPTLVVPGHVAPRPVPFTPAAAANGRPADAAPKTGAGAPAGGESFRIGFESKGGPLNLRAIDDAVNAHPGVRDVALLDFDGRRATLKVWLAPAADAEAVRAALSERAAGIGGGGEVAVLALEDVA